MWDQDLEKAYLQQNPDVSDAVALGTVPSGYAHFMTWGYREQRLWWSNTSRDLSGKLTRWCYDPWQYVEVGARGGLKPCCNFSTLGMLPENADEWGELRNSGDFRKLRKELLSGDLSAHCQRCHIRETVPVDRLAQVLQTLSGSSSNERHLDPLPLTAVRIDINEKCNLRCDYCAASRLGYDGVEMSDDIFSTVRLLLAQSVASADIHVNGHGETTFHPKWTEYCRRILNTGRNVHITTNFARLYSDLEVRLLARFRTIQISLDSDDAEMMRGIRKSVKVENICENLRRVRRTPLLNNAPMPVISFSVGLYDPAIWRLESFTEFMINLGAQTITFWNLVEMDHQTKVRALTHLNAEEKARVRVIVGRVRARLDAAKVRYSFAGDFSDGDGTPLV
jgi:molybdenum cofactor biosynthesis enzyme MoaA